MEHHTDRDSYICQNGRELTVTNERRSKTTSGYVSIKTYYRCSDCTAVLIKQNVSKETTAFIKNDIETTTDFDTIWGIKQDCRPAKIFANATAPSFLLQTLKTHIILITDGRVKDYYSIILYVMDNSPLSVLIYALIFFLPLTDTSEIFPSMSVF